MFALVENGLLLFISSKGIRNKARFAGYLLLNVLNRLNFFKLKGRNFKLTFNGITFWVGLSSAELGSYIEIFIKNVYDLTSDFIAGEGDVVIDIGSNIGLYAIKQANRAGIGGKIWSFEPNPLSFERLTMNLEENSIKNVKTFKKAVSSKAGSVKFSVNFSMTVEGKLFHPGETAVSDKDTIIEVECVTLDDFVVENNIEKIDILKIDTEGEELEVLRGASNNALPVTEKIVMEYHGEERRQSVSRFLKEKNFSAVLEDEKNRILYFKRGF